MWLETERHLEVTTNRINDLPIDLPAGSWLVGPPLDKSVYKMLVSKQKGFLESQNTERRNAFSQMSMPLFKLLTSALLLAMYLG
jgi:hypothetical protein